MELNNNIKNAINCLLVVILLFTTSIHIDLNKVVIRVMSINNVINYKEQWIFVGTKKNYNILVDKELEYLQKLKNEKTSKRKAM